MRHGSSQPSVGSCTFVGTQPWNWLSSHFPFAGSFLSSLPFQTSPKKTATRKNGNTHTPSHAVRQRGGLKTAPRDRIHFRQAVRERAGNEKAISGLTRGSGKVRVPKPSCPSPQKKNGYQWNFRRKTYWPAWLANCRQIDFGQNDVTLCLSYCKSNLLFK